MEKKNILTFPTTWMNLKDMPIKINRYRKRNTTQSHLYVDIKKIEFIETQMVVTRGSEGREMLVKGYKTSIRQKE